MAVSKSSPCRLASILIFYILPASLVDAHGRLVEPPSRASAWRYGFNTPPNYNDHELFCGGFTRQWVQNEGKCGVCGDPWDAKPPRAHEFGGTYGQGVIVRKYPVGGTITIRVELTANHYGYFEFSVCPDYRDATQECLDRNILKLAKPQDDVEHRGVRYFPKDGNKVYEMKYRLPVGLECEHCILQWRYIAGNNWGNCPNGTGAVGCGPQEEFRSCSDITIGSKSPASEPPPYKPPDTPTVTTTKPPKPEDLPSTYSPLTAILITLFSFLLAFLTLAVLYIHYYQIGGKVKRWLKGGDKVGVAEKGGDKVGVAVDVPVAPPRAKRLKSMSEKDMYEVNLSA